MSSPASAPGKGLDPLARPRTGRMMTGPRRMIHAVRYVNDELTRASEAIIRSARAPQPRAQATAAENREPAAQRVDQAA